MRQDKTPKTDRSVSTRDLWRLDAASAAAMIRSGTISSRGLIDSVLGRLEDVNPRINAITLTLADDARRSADQADLAVQRGDALGPLHGIPVTIKLNVDQTGCPTDRGCIAQRDLIAKSDNPVVINLRQAGAVFVGRTNGPCHLLRWFTDNALHGRTLNPWNAAMTAGGSSGGAAAAVASGIGPIGLGNDLAGSVRYPAYCCGVYGLKPSPGRIPSHNETAQGPSSISAQLMSVQGPLARTVADLRLGFDAMAQPHVRDPYCVPPPIFPPSSKPIRVALVPDVGDVHPAVSDAVRAAGRRLAAAGYIVEEVTPPLYAETAALWPRIAMGDIVAQLEPVVAETGDDAIRRALALWKAVFPKGDASLTLRALGERDRHLRAWMSFLAGYPVVVMPTSNEPAFDVDADVKDEATTARIIAAQGPMMAVSALGLPGLSVPIGMHDGMPLGVQIVAGRYREDLCLAAAEAIEAGSPRLCPIDPV